MKIIIDTHERQTEEVDDLTKYLLENTWDYRVNNAEDAPPPPEFDPDDQICQHTFMNGECTKCHWLQI